MGDGNPLLIGVGVGGGRRKTPKCFIGWEVGGSVGIGR